MTAPRLRGPISAMILAGVLISGCGDAGSNEIAADSQDATRLTETGSSDEAKTTVPVNDSGDQVESESTAEESSSADSVAADAQSEESASASEESASASETEYEYSDEPEAASGVVATLCNLDPTYLSSLRNEDSSGEPVVDDDLRLSVLAMGDQIAYWKGLQDEYPDAAEDIDSAEMIVDYWDEALLEHDNGDVAASKAAMTSADDVIASMEGDVAPESAQCVG